MKLLRIVPVLLGLLAVVSSSSASAEEGYIRFVGQNLIATANGEFKTWRITGAKIDESDPGASFVEIEIDVASLDTDNQKRDDHLRDPDFFEVEKWPTAKVRVHDVKKDEDEYVASFDVTIRDKSKTLPGTFKVVSTAPPIVEGGLTLDRMDFGVGEEHSSLNPMSIEQEIPITFRAVLPQ